jgi:hypothetical protein
MSASGQRVENFVIVCVLGQQYGIMNLLDELELVGFPARVVISLRTRMRQRYADRQMGLWLPLRAPFRVSIVPLSTSAGT